MREANTLPEPVHGRLEDKPFPEGLKSGAVIALGYIPIAIAFGLLADASGIPWWVTVMMSLTVFAGASQFVGINMMALGAAGWEVVMTTFILNLRHFLLSTSLSQKIEPGASRLLLYLVAFGVTDETFSMASLRKGGRLRTAYLLGLNLIAFSAWNFGTWLGLLVGSNLPGAVQSSLGISLYAMFIGLLVPSLKKSAPAIVVTAISIAAASIFHWMPPFTKLSTGWVIILSTLLATVIGAYIFPPKDDSR